MSIGLLEENDIYLTYVAGKDEAVLPVGTILPRRTSAAGWVITRGQPLLRHNIATGFRFAEDEQLVTKGIHSAMFIPLRTKGQVLGTWNLSSRKIGAYNPDDLKIAQSMADQLAIAVENARLFEEVQTGREQLRQLNRQIVAAQEEERQRLSRELHDEAGQALTALKIGLDLIRVDLPPEAETLHEGIAEAVNLTDMTMEQLRLLARDLRPPALDTAGLNPTLEGLCRDFARRTQLSIDYASTELTTLSDTANICLYRFLQEALTNVAKHAQANQVWVKLSQGGGMVNLIVRDDGRGIDQQAGMAVSERPKGIGLVGMQERLELLGGWLEIESRPGQGTRLVAQIPMEGN
jgi:signal transduction histidine kinase